MYLWRARFPSQIDALPIDLYRLLVGLLSAAYFICCLLEFPDFSSPNGLIDHELSLRIFWFTRLNLFQPGMDPFLLQAAQLTACLSSLAVSAGFRTKPCAAWALIVAVVTFRWNFLVANLNDTAIQLMLLWVLLLPTGKTLRLRDAISSPRDCWRQWASVQVPSTMLWLFFINLTLYYGVTGLSKLSSAFWRDGVALHCVLNLPLSRTAGWWPPSLLPVTAAFNYLTLLIEPLLPVIFLLPKGSRWKWTLGSLWFGLHAAIILTIGVEFANFGQLFALVLVFREEGMDWLRKRFSISSVVQQLPSNALANRWLVRFACAYFIALTLAMSRGVPVVGSLWQTGFATLWIVGLAQEYHLFDWIDGYNLVARNRLTSREGRDYAPELLFPKGLRGTLLQSYVHNIRWMCVPAPLMGELRHSILQRAGRRAGENLAKNDRNEGASEIVFSSNVQYIGSSNLDLHQGESLELAQYNWHHGELHLEEAL